MMVVTGWGLSWDGGLGCDTRLSSRPHLSEKDLGRQGAVGSPGRCLSRDTGLRGGGRHISSKHVPWLRPGERTEVLLIFFTPHGDPVS